MGFDFKAKNKDLGEDRYFHANTFHMSFLRCAMIEAGVKEELVYKKFIANDHFFVTPLQSKTIAEKLKTWLKGKNLMLNIVEENATALEAIEPVFKIIEVLGAKEKSLVKMYRKKKPVIIRLGRKTRRSIRDFAYYCEKSEGFWVD